MNRCSMLKGLTSLTLPSAGTRKRRLSIDREMCPHADGEAHDSYAPASWPRGPDTEALAKLCDAHCHPIDAFHERENVEETMSKLSLGKVRLLQPGEGDELTMHAGLRHVELRRLS